MKTRIIRFVCTVLAVSLLLTVCGCSSKKNVVVSDDPVETPTVETEPITVPEKRKQLTVMDMMPMRLENISELNNYAVVSEEEGQRVYMVKNETDLRLFMLVVTYDADGAITSAVLSYGDTSAVLVGENASITGGIRDIVLTEPLDLPEMTMENLLVLDPTDVTVLEKYAYTPVDGDTREYSVVNKESDKRCTFTVSTDDTGAVVEATLSYGDVSKNMLENSMIAILDILTEMEGVQE